MSTRNSKNVERMHGTLVRFVTSGKPRDEVELGTRRALFSAAMRDARTSEAMRRGVPPDRLPRGWDEAGIRPAGRDAERMFDESHKGTAMRSYEATVQATLGAFLGAIEASTGGGLAR